MFLLCFFYFLILGLLKQIQVFWSSLKFLLEVALYDVSFFFSWTTYANPCCLLVIAKAVP